MGLCPILFEHVARNLLFWLFEHVARNFLCFLLNVYMNTIFEDKELDWFSLIQNIVIKVKMGLCPNLFCFASAFSSLWF